MSQHWITVTESAFPWEMAALRYLRAQLPTFEPFRSWANFAFVADDGSINEVDLLVVSLYRLYLVEMKSRLGRVTGDARTGSWSHDGRTVLDDNPLLEHDPAAQRVLQHALEHWGQPALDDLLRQADAAWRWDAAGECGQGAYRPQYQTPDAHSSTSTLPRLSTAAPPGDGYDPAAETVHAVEVRLARAVHERCFLLHAFTMPVPCPCDTL